MIPPGAPLVSDPVDLPVKALASIAVSLYLPKRTGLTSVHWDGAQTGYISGPGDMTKTADFKADSTIKSRVLLSRVLTTAKPDSSAIVFFGDSITDGACSTVDTNNRWPDHIAERLQAEGHTDVRCTRPIPAFGWIDGQEARSPSTPILPSASHAKKAEI